MRKSVQSRKMICTHCQTPVRNTKNDRASRFGLPPCVNCGRKNFEPTPRSYLVDDRKSHGEARQEDNP